MSVDGDGNCMAHSLSRAISGVEVFFHVLRAELLAELQGNVEFYKNRSIESGFYTEDDWARDLESAGPSQAGQAGMWMSGMHIFGMANVLRRPIFLVDARQMGSAGGSGSPVEPDLMVVQQLANMGFSPEAAVRAAIACRNDAGDAMQWVLEHEGDPLLNEPMDESEQGEGGGEQREASASAKGGLFLPLRFSPEECQVDGVMPSPLMIACANADASHFCAMLTVTDPDPTDDGVITADWTVPETAEAGEPFEDSMEVNGQQVSFRGVVPEGALPGDVIQITLNFSERTQQRKQFGKLDKMTKEKLRQMPGLQRRQLSSTTHRIVEDGLKLVHALSLLLTGERCEPEPEETERLMQDYQHGMGQEPIVVVFVNLAGEDFQMSQVMHDGTVGKTWPVYAHGQFQISSPIGAHFRVFNQSNERVWSVTITDQHATDDMVFIDESQRVAAPELEQLSRKGIKNVVQCLGQIVAKPGQAQYRKLSLSNKNVREHMLPVEGVRELLEYCGFVEEVVEGKQCLHIPGQQLDLARLEGVLVTLRSALAAGTQSPHPVHLNIAIPATEGGGTMDPTRSVGPRLADGTTSGGSAGSADGTTSGGSAGSAGSDTAWLDYQYRTDTIRRHVVNVDGGLELLAQAAGFTRDARDATGELTLRLHANDLHTAVRCLEDLEQAQEKYLVAAKSRMNFGLDEQAFGQIQFTQGLCDMNDWEFARRFANGDGCWELGCGKQGGREAAVAMLDAKERFSQLLARDYKGAMRKQNRVTCGSCGARLVVMQYQIESTKGGMLEIMCSQCGTPVPLTAPSLHTQIQAALDREAGLDRAGSGGSVGSTSSASAGGHRLGDRPAGGDEDLMGLLSIDSIAHMSSEPELEPEHDDHVFHIKLPETHSGNTQQDFVIDRDSEFDKALEALISDVQNSGGMLLTAAVDTSGIEDGDADGASLRRNLSMGAKPRDTSVLDLARQFDKGALDAGERSEVGLATAQQFGRLVAELSGEAYGYEQGAVVRALKESGGDLFGALDVLERRGSTPGEAAPPPIVVSR